MLELDLGDRLEVSVTPRTYVFGNVDWNNKVVGEHPRGEGGFAVQFFLASVGSSVAAGCIGYLLTVIGPAPTPIPGAAMQIPLAFWISTGLLAVGSAILVRAEYLVKHERQRPFRHCLKIAFALGAVFFSVQIYGLWWILKLRNPAHAQTGANAFVFAVAVLHAMHFFVAMLFIIYVTLKAHWDRYDHEYYWGVTVCAYFWHVLGVVWLAIMFFMIVAGTQQAVL